MDHQIRWFVGLTVALLFPHSEVFASFSSSIFPCNKHKFSQRNKRLLNNRKKIFGWSSFLVLRFIIMFHYKQKKIGLWLSWLECRVDAWEKLGNQWIETSISFVPKNIAQNTSISPMRLLHIPSISAYLIVRE